MEPQDFPLLYKTSDSSAIRAQKRHFRLVKAKIVLLLIIAAVASFAWYQLPNIRTPAAIALAIFLVVSLFVSAIMDMKKFDSTWFSSRAIAESVKTESWKFMMKVNPYGLDISDSEAENRFLDRLDEILHSQPSVWSELTPNSQSAQITNRMRLVRNETLEQRRSYYVKNRINEQKDWYARKANWNKSQGSMWFVIAWTLQVATVAIAIIVISFGDLFMNPVGILTTASAGMLSWIYARNYRELSQSYSLVAQELSLLEDQTKQVQTEEKMAEIVLDTERTISREHTIWLARRL